MSRFEHIGSVSSGTMRPEDLIPEFSDLLDDLKEDLSLSLPIDASFEQTEATKREVSRIDDLLAAMERRQEIGGYWDSDDCHYDLEELFEELNAFAPSYFYFGSHSGDGADYGFWLSESWKDDFDGLRVADLSEVPADYSGEIMHVNDHGNVTLYVAELGELSEVWAIV